MRCWASVVGLSILSIISLLGIILLGAFFRKDSFHASQAPGTYIATQTHPANPVPLDLEPSLSGDIIYTSQTQAVTVGTQTRRVGIHHTSSQPSVSESSISETPHWFVEDVERAMVILTTL